MSPQEIEYAQSKKIEVPAYEWYLAMQMFGWLAAGNTKSEKPEEVVSELREASMKQYNRMRHEVTGEDLFWKMRDTYEQINQTSIKKPGP